MTVNIRHDVAAPQTEAEPLARIERERVMIERGESDFRAGRFLQWSIVKAWLERLDDDPDAPMPAAPQREPIGL